MMSITLCSRKHGPHEMFYDDEDHHIILSGHWMLRKARNTFYAYAQKGYGSSHKKKVVFTRLFHKEVMNSKYNQIDHKDGNGLNNCKSNLRLCTSQQNMRNRVMSKNNKCGYKGVSYHRQMGLFRARVNVNQKQVFCRYFKTSVEAARAYNDAAILYFGEFAKLNLI